MLIRAGLAKRTTPPEPHHAAGVQENTKPSPTDQKATAIWKSRKNLTYFKNAMKGMGGSGGEEAKLDYQHLKSRVGALGLALVSVASVTTVVALGVLLFSNPVSGGATAFLATAYALDVLAYTGVASMYASLAFKVNKGTTCREDYFNTFNRERLHQVDPNNFTKDFKDNYNFDQNSDTDKPKIPWNLEKPTALIIRAKDDWNGAVHRQTWSHRKNCVELAKTHNVLECQIGSEEELRKVLGKLESITSKKVDFLQFIAHGSPSKMQLGPDFGYHEDNKKLHTLLGQHLTDNATILLDSCSTGRDMRNGSQNLASSISTNLGENRKVIASQSAETCYDLDIRKKENGNLRISFARFYPFMKNINTKVFQKGQESTVFS